MLFVYIFSKTFACCQDVFILLLKIISMQSLQRHRVYLGSNKGKSILKAVRCLKILMSPLEYSRGIKFLSHPSFILRWLWHEVVHKDLYVKNLICQDVYLPWEYYFTLSSVMLYVFLAKSICLAPQCKTFVYKYSCDMQESLLQWRCCKPRKEIINSEQGILLMMCDWPVRRGFTGLQGQEEKRYQPAHTRIKCPSQSHAKETDKPSATKCLPSNWKEGSAFWVWPSGWPHVYTLWDRIWWRKLKLHWRQFGPSRPIHLSIYQLRPHLSAFLFLLTQIIHLFSSRTVLIPLTSRRWWLQVLKCHHHTPKNADDRGQTLLTTELPVWWDSFWFPEATRVTSLPRGRQAVPAPYRMGREKSNGYRVNVIQSLMDGTGLPSPEKAVLFWESGVVGARLKAFIGLIIKKPTRRQQSQGTFCSGTFKLEACLSTKKWQERKTISFQVTEV